MKRSFRHGFIFALVLACHACGSEPSTSPMWPASVCGNGILESGELCDHGAANGESDSCSAFCSPNFCGDGLGGPGEECDLGPQNGPASTCTNACTVDYCGNAVVGLGEECDDGNDVAGDGCTDCLYPDSVREVLSVMGARLDVTDRIHTLAAASNDMPWILVTTLEGELLRTIPGITTGYQHGWGTGVLVVDDANTVFGTQHQITEGPLSQDASDVYIAAYDASGAQSWSTKVAKDSAGNYLQLYDASEGGNYVAFAGYETDLVSQGLVLVFEKDGTLVHRTAIQIDGAQTSVHAIAVLDDGVSCVTGAYGWEFSSRFVACLSNAGSLLWDVDLGSDSGANVYVEGGYVNRVTISGVRRFALDDGADAGVAFDFEVPADAVVHKVERDQGYFLVHLETAGVDEVHILGDTGAKIWSTRPGTLVSVVSMSLGWDQRLYVLDAVGTDRILVYDPGL